MNKNSLRAIIAAAVVLVVYNLVVFIVPCAKTPAFWISWVFTLMAFGLLGAAVYIAFGKKPDARSRFYGFPIARLGVVYAVCQVVVGSVFMALGFVIPWWVALLVCAVGFGFAVLGLLSAESVVEEIDQLDVKLKRDVALMRGLQAKVGYMAAQCDDAEAAKAVQAFAEELRYSDPVSSEAIWAAEAELSAAVDSLHQAVVDGNGDAVKRLCRRASALLAERNRLCKLNK